MRLKKGEGEACSAMVAVTTPIHQDRLEQAQRLARRHIELQARQLAAELAVELRSRAKAAETESQELAKQCRMDRREDMSEEDRDRQRQESHEHETRTLARAQYLEWATAAERLHRQDSLAKRRFDAGLARDAEIDRLAELQRQHAVAIEERQKTHELALWREREQKAARYDAKLARICSMEKRRDEILDDMSKMRHNAYNKFDALKALAYESAVHNNDDMLRRLLEELVPSLKEIPYTKLGSFHRATSAGPCLREAPQPPDSPYSPRETPRARARSAGPGRIRARSRESSLESPRRFSGCNRKVGHESPRKQCCPIDLRLVGIVGSAQRRPLSPGQMRKRPTEKSGSASRSTSATSLATSLGASGFVSSSYGSTSWESIGAPSPVASQVSQLLASARNNPVVANPDTSDSSAPTDCPLRYTTPRRPQRGIDIATYAKIARGVQCRPVEVEVSQQPIGA